MAGKRAATSDLNHDNWNVEEEKEESGTFLKAAPDVINTRVIKTARRRNNDGDTMSTTNIFSGFSSAFGDKTISTPPTASSFSFLSNLTNGKVEPAKTNGSSIFSNKIVTTVKEVPAVEKKEKEILSPVSPEKPEEYYAKLKGLNQSVTQWIKSNVDENPYCILTPIFRDYERYLKEIENVNCTPNATTPSITSSTFTLSTKPAATNCTPIATTPSITSSTFTLSTKPTPTTQSSTTFQIPSYYATTPKAEPKEINKSSLFSIKPEISKSPFEMFSSKTSQDSPSFSFGSRNVAATSPSPFSFGIKPLAAPPAQSSEDAAKSDDEENEDDSPPTVTFTPVVEESSVYSKRCKVFVKKDGNYSDRGTGTLYLKTVENSDKYQLVVRAENSLGNLLLNLILSDSLPIQRMGKNNVMMVCIPTPGSASVPVLLRVKTAEEADELFETLNKFKK